MSIDIFIPTYFADFIWLEYCLKSIKKYASGFRNIIVVSDNDGNIIPDNIVNIMPIKLFYTPIPKIPTTYSGRPGYLWQQLLKINWVNYTDADAVFILDSDEMLTKPLTPSLLRDDHGRFRWIYRNWGASNYGAGSADCWYEPTKSILKIDPKFESMCCAGFIFERHTTHNFIEYLNESIFEYKFF